MNLSRNAWSDWAEIPLQSSSCSREFPVASIRKQQATYKSRRCPATPLFPRLSDLSSKPPRFISSTSCETTSGGALKCVRNLSNCFAVAPSVSPKSLVVKAAFPGGESPATRLLWRGVQSYRLWYLAFLLLFRLLSPPYSFSSYSSSASLKSSSSSKFTSPARSISARGLKSGTSTPRRMSLSKSSTISRFGSNAMVMLLRLLAKKWRFSRYTSRARAF